MSKNGIRLGNPILGYFRGKAVVVTGASSGIGEDVALSFGRAKAAVALIARRKHRLDEVAQRIDAAGGKTVAIACDVTRRDEVQSAIEAANAAFGTVDVLVNSAGVLIADPVERMRPEDLQKMMAVNVYGALYAIQAVLPLMKQRRAGSIVNIASLAGRRGMSPLGGYSASKFAMVGFTEALRMELFGSGVRVSLVMPGVIDTPMTAGARDRNQMLGDMPLAFSMPARWVTWAVMAAVAFGLAEVDVPLGAGAAEKLASLFPGMTDAVLSVGSRVLMAAGRFLGRGIKAAREAGGDTAAGEDSMRAAN